MVLSETEKNKILNDVFHKHYPEATEQQRAKISEIVKCGFMPNYSPIKKEQESPYSSGTGVSFCDFTIVIARGSTRFEPVGIDREELSKMLWKVNSI
jgi:hypothetical protein